MSILKAIQCWGETFISLKALSRDPRCIIPYQLLWGRLKRARLSPEEAVSQPLGPTSKNKEFKNETSGTKYCISCKQIHSLAEFTTDSHGRKGRRGSCKKCVLKSRQNPQYREIARRAQLKKYQNFSNEQYENLFNTQNGLCASCGRTPSTGYNNRLYVDHNHETGEVCGLICLNCNVAAGHLNDDWHDALHLTLYLLRTHSTSSSSIT